MRHIDEFRDPRIDPVEGDRIQVVFDNGSRENRLVVGSSYVVGIGRKIKYVNEDTDAIHSTSIGDWRTDAEEGRVLDRSLR